jgi:hypothetical protein
MDSTKNIKDYVRNPLGIVALFISLIYGFASLLLGSAADKLESPERWPLIGFIVLFPFAVLFVFYKLVTKHHGKLYSPGDYKSDDAFLKTLTAEERRQKLMNEVEEVTGAPVSDLTPPSESISTQSKVTNRVSSVKDKIIRAEQYVISRLETELQISPTKDVKVGKQGYVFDAGYIVPGERATFLEVKSLSRPQVNILVINELIYRSKLVAEQMKIDTKFIFALVCDFDLGQSDFVQDLWSKALSASDLNYELRFYPAADALA